MLDQTPDVSSSPFLLINQGKLANFDSLSHLMSMSNSLARPCHRDTRKNMLNF